MSCDPPTHPPLPPLLPALPVHLLSGERLCFCLGRISECALLAFPVVGSVVGSFHVPGETLHATAPSSCKTRQVEGKPWFIRPQSNRKTTNRSCVVFYEHLNVLQGVVIHCREEQYEDRQTGMFPLSGTLSSDGQRRKEIKQTANAQLLSCLGSVTYQPYQSAIPQISLSLNTSKAV